MSVFWAIFAGMGVLGRLWAFAGVLRMTSQRWRITPRPWPGGAGPRVVVCVPARNEEQNLPTCLLYLQRQDYPNLQIRVVDDHSTDATADIVRSAMKEDPRISLIQAAPLPEGWGGKNWALWQAVGTEGEPDEILLFVDADTHQHSQAVSTVVAEMEGRDVLVVLGGQYLESFWEKLINPFFWTFVFQLVDPRRAEDPRFPDDAMGNGQFAAFRRGKYLEAGGHQAVKDVVIEDVALVRHVKRAGGVYALRVGPDLTRTRMYRNVREIWNGFSKNTAVIRPEHRRLDLVISLVAWILMFQAEIWPYLALALHIHPVVACFQLVFSFWARKRLYEVMCFDRNDPLFWRKVWWYYLSPLGATVALAINLNSIRLGLSRGGTWKGRRLAGRPI